MSTSKTRRRHGWYKVERFALGFMLLYLWSVLGLVFSDFYGLMQDRAFIDMRVAEQLLQGCGFSYHCQGHTPQVFSSFGYVLVLSVGQWLFATTTHAAQVLGFLAIFATLTMSAFVIRNQRWHTTNHLSRAIIVVCMLPLFFIDHFLLTQMTTGTELALVAFCLMGLFATVQRTHRRSVPYWLLGLFLLRPTESLVFIGLFPIFFSEDARQPSFWYPIGAGIIVVTGLRMAFFGTPIPPSLAYGVSQAITHPGHVIHQVTTWLWAYPWLWLAPFALLLPQVQRTTRYMLAASGAWIVLGSATMQADSLAAHLAMAVVPVLSVLAAAGVFAALHRLELALPAWAPMALPWLVPGVVSALLLVAWADHTIPQKKLVETHKQQTSLGQYLATTAPKGATFAASKIGLIGYVSRLPFLPINASPAVFPSRHPLAEGTVPPQHKVWMTWLAKHKPTIIVMPPQSSKDFFDDDTYSTRTIEETWQAKAKKRQLPYRIQRAEYQPLTHWPLLVRTK